jgi:predicted benzoate:H+ symporter BenE
MARILSVVTVLVGLALIGTPWLLRFTADRTAVADVVVTGIIVALLGMFTTVDLLAGSLPHSRASSER